MHIQLRFATRTDTTTESGIVHGGCARNRSSLLEGAAPKRSPGTAGMEKSGKETADPPAIATDITLFLNFVWLFFRAL